MINNVPEGTWKEDMTDLEDAIERATAGTCIVLVPGEEKGDDDAAPEDGQVSLVVGSNDEENENALILTTSIDADGGASVSISAFTGGELVEPNMLVGPDGSILLTHAI